jgi:hypothetical protein
MAQGKLLFLLMKQEMERAPAPVRPARHRC